MSDIPSLIGKIGTATEAGWPKRKKVNVDENNILTYPLALC